MKALGVLFLTAALFVAIWLAGGRPSDELLVDEPDQAAMIPAQLTMPGVMMCRPVLFGPPSWAPLAGAGTPVVLAAVLLGHLYFSGDRT